MDFDQKAISLPEDILGEGKMSLFEIYAKLHGFTANATPALYQELKTMLYEEHQNIALEDKLILLTYLINFSIKRINSGDLKSIQEAFDLYEFGIEHSILVESGFLTADKFRNILIIACELGKHEWAEKFLRSFIQNVPEEHRSNLTALGEASILFAKEKYSDCLNYLNDVEFKDYGYVLQTKFIRLKCYYELRSEYRRSLDPFIISFDNIVLRNKAIHEETLQSYHNAIKIIRMLLRPKNVKTKNEIMQELESLKFIAGKIWLMKKIQSYDLE